MRARRLGFVYAAETGYVLAQHPDTVRAPDVAFLRRERVESAGEANGYWKGAPDLVVEVVSSGDTRSEVEGKVAEWLAAGAHGPCRGCRAPGRRRSRAGLTADSRVRRDDRWR